MTPDQIAPLFTRADGAFLCARWGRPIVPVVFGVTDAVLPVAKGAIEAVAALAGHELAETDGELGANLMVFFLSDWDELPLVPNLEKMVPDLGPLCARLAAAGANQYRTFRFDERGAIKAAFVFLRMDAALAEMPAEDLMLVQAVKVMLSWGEGAFTETSVLGQVGGHVVLRPDLAALIRAAYHPMLPVVARDAAHALRLAARMPEMGA